MPQSHKKQAYWPLAAGAILLLLAISLTATQQLPYRETLETPAEHPTDDSTPLVNPVFSDRTLQSGLFAYHLQGGKSLTGLDETLGAGACALDYDNDNNIDLFVVGGSGQSRYYGKREWWQQARGNVLYRNTGNGTFENVTTAAGLIQLMWGMGCIAGDLDNDGDADLLITNKGRNILYQNNGNGGFTDVTASSGISGNEWSTSATLADYDGDGLLDIYIVNYIDYSKHHLTYEGSTGFKSTLPVRFDARLYNSQPNKLYKNTGELTFTDKTTQAGVSNTSGRGLAATWSDLDTDGYPDLVVSNDAGFPNSVFLNQRNGQFTDISEQLQLNTTRATRGLGMGDIDNDGDIDLVFGTEQGSLPLLFVHGNTPWTVKSQPLLSGNHFTELARETGLNHEQYATFSSWGAGLRDFNNDGWLDVMLTNGLVTADPDSPAIPLGQPKQLWLNRGNGLLTETGNEAGPGFHDAISGRSTVFADFDNDGDIDIYATHNHYLGQLLVNNSPSQNWLGLRLVANSGSQDAIGTKIWLQTTAGTQYRELSDASGFLSGSDKRIHFGLGANTTARVTIEWPDRTQTIFNNIPVNRYLQITQGSNEATPINFSSPGEITPPLDFLFEKNRATHHFLNWGANQDAFTVIKPSLSQALASTDPAIRKQAIDLLRDIKSPQALALLLTALSDVSETNRLAALTAAGEYEEGYIVHSLLRLFDDPDEQIRCALADLFAFYFREEEAVTHYKYLAVPHLIRMLDEPSATLRTCAANALADAEQFRAVNALLKKINDDDINVRVAAVRALGKIREKSAEQALQSALIDTTQPPLVIAHTLISLKRLGAENTSTALKQLLPVNLSADNSDQAMRSLQAVALLLGHIPDGVVFKPDEIRAGVLQWLIANRAYIDTDTSGHSDKLLATCLQILHRVSNDTLVKLATQYTKHGNATVRGHAFIVLLVSDRESANNIIDVALTDKDIITQSMVIEHLMTTGVNPSYKQLKPLLAHSTTREMATRLLTRLTSPESAREKAQILSSDHSSNMQKLTILEAMNDRHKIANTLPESLMLGTPYEIRIATLNAWERINRKARVTAMPAIIEQGLSDTQPAVQQRAYTILIHKHNSWARKAVEQLLFNNIARMDLRLSILEALATTENTVAESIIQRLSTLRNDPLSDDAVAYLGHFTSPTSLKIIMASINNEDDTFRRRMAASSALYLLEPAQAMNALFSITGATAKSTP